MLRSLLAWLTFFQSTRTQLLGLGVGLFFCTMPGFAQTSGDQTIYTVVECQPEFPGGMVALKEYIQKNLTYPAEARKATINGRVFVSFVVETDGRITNVRLLKGIGYGCDDEAIRVVSAMPCWTPGSQSGLAIRVKYNLPVVFGIQESAATYRRTRAQ